MSNDVNAGTGAPAAPGAKAVVEVTAADLAGHGAVFCPNPKMPLWSGHPRVFIDVVKTGQGACPYCGTLYRLKAGEKVSAGH
jgi:uncharacterized Zn-finger protein